jgi:putative transposase
MPRQSRLDAPHALHHVTMRGLERRAIFTDGPDRSDYAARLGALADAGALIVYAWARLPNHAHLVANLPARDRDPGSGHSALLGTIPRPWQDTRTILA